MAEFKKLITTNKGRELISKLIAGTSTVQFTRAALSSAKYTDDQVPMLTVLTGIQQQTEISKVTRLNNASVKMEVAFSNAAVAVGYSLNTIGVYAQDPDEGEVLYAVANASVAGYVPPYNGLTVSGVFLTLTTTVSNADNVILEVDPAAVATIGDIQALEAEIADLQAYIGYTDNTVFGVEADFANKKFTRLAGAIGKTPGTPFDGVKAFGGRRRCNITNAGAVVAYKGDPGYSETGKLLQAVTANDTVYPIGTVVQTMVEQPKFYYKVVPLALEPIVGGKGFHMRKARYYISDTMRTGFKLHPAFMSNGKEKNFIYLSAYEGSLFDVSANAYILDDAQVADFATDMLCSIANAKPASGLTQNLTRGNVRLLAQKRGAGWQQIYGATASAAQLLFMVEYAAFNIQGKIGMGNTTKTDDAATSMTEITGATTNLGNTTGSVTNGNGINIVTYRGEENFWGNIWTWVDGMNINANGIHELYVADSTFADDKITDNYKNAGITLAKTNGYVSAFGYNADYDWLFMASETLGDSALPVGDHFWQNNTYAAIMVAVLGGCWVDGVNAGGFAWAVTNVSGDRNRIIGGRLVYIPA